MTAPIVGATQPQQLADAFAAVELSLGEEELHRLEKHYVPRVPTGF